MRTLYKRLKGVAFPLIFGFLLFYVVPFITSLRYSVLKSAFDNEFVGLHNYLEVFRNRYFQLALKNTFVFSLIAIPLLITVAIILAVCVSELGRKGDIFLGLLLWPMLLPSASLVPVLRALFGESISNTMGGRIQLTSLHVVFFWKNVGFFVIMLRTAIYSIPKEQYEAASLDGAGAIRQQVYITLPGISSILSFSLMLAIVYSFRIFKEAFLLYGSYPSSEIYMMQHYMNNHFLKLNYQNLTTAAFIFSLIVFWIVQGGVKLTRKLEG